jgi:protoporphyrinogen oxidase
LPHRVVVLGAGVTGLAAAWRLPAPAFDVEILEAGDRAGGIGSSMPVEGFVLDHGIHGLYSARPETKPIVEELRATFGEDFLTVSKKTSIWFRRRFLRYPLEAKDLFRALDPSTAARCFVDFLATRLRKRLRPVGAAPGFEQWVVDRFGRSFYGLYFGPYVEKVWGVPGSRMSSAWLARRISEVSLWKVARNAVLRRFRRGPAEHEMHSLQPQTFLYPPKGSGLLVGRIGEAARRGGARLSTRSRAERLLVEGRRVTAVEVNRDGRRETVSLDALVSTIPLPALLRLFGPALPRRVALAGERLRFRAMAIVVLFVDRPRVYEDQWVYYSDPAIPFNRVNEFTNLGPGFSPPGRTALSCEITCFAGDATWNAPDAALADRCARAFEDLALLRPGEVIGHQVARLGNAYPIFEVGVEEALAEVLSFVEGHENLHTIGRQGRFEYINMDECVWHATRAAAAIAARAGAGVGARP